MTEQEYEHPIDLALEILHHMVHNLIAERDVLVLAAAQLGYNPNELDSVRQMNQFIESVPGQMEQLDAMGRSGVDYHPLEIKQIVDPLEARGDQVLLTLNHEIRDLRDISEQERIAEEYPLEEGGSPTYFEYEEHPLGE